MEPAAIREAVRRHPFQPFRLKLVDGTEINVRHPELIAVAPNGRRVVAFADDGAMSILEPLLIQSIELPAPQQSGGPGQTNGNQN